MVKAQITPFILIGMIVLLIAVSFVYYYTWLKVVPVVEQVVVPPDAKPVYDIVSDCIKQLAVSALERAGLQAGYVDVPVSIQKQPLSRIALDPYDILFVPYWYYNDEQRIPSLKNIESQVANHVRNNLAQCAVFSSDEFTVVPKSNITISVSANKEVVLSADWDLDVVMADKTVRLEKFILSIPLALKEIYDSAVAIYKAEADGLFLANLTMDIISMSEDVPIAGMELSCRKKQWNTDEVMQNVQGLIKANLALVRIKNTKVLPFQEKDRMYRALAKERERFEEELVAGAEDVELDDGVVTPDDAFEYFNMQLIPNMQDTNLKASIEYSPDWGMLFDVNPRDGKKMVTSRAKTAKMLSFLCFNQWHFTYDITYPVIVKLTSNEALGGKGYTFQYALPVSIDDNQPIRRDTTLYMFEGIIETVDFCEELGSTAADIRVVGSMSGGNRLLELEGTNITYSCFAQECALGKTKADAAGYRLYTYLPQGCTNPFITAQHDGYLESTRQMTGGKLEIPLKKLKKLAYSVVKHDYGIDGQLGSAQQIETHEIPVISLSMIGENYDQFPTQPRLEWTTSQDSIKFIEHASRTYGSVPKPQPSFLFLSEQDQQYELSIILTDSFGREIGGYFNENLTITGNEIRNADSVVLHVIKYVPAPVDDKDKVAMYTYLYEGDYKQKLKPVFK